MFRNIIKQCIHIIMINDKQAAMGIRIFEANDHSVKRRPLNLQKQTRKKTKKTIQQKANRRMNQFFPPKSVRKTNI